jgi:hypothetical protein
VLGLVGGSSIVLTPFTGAHDMFSISYHGQPLEALIEHVFYQGSRRGMVTIDPTMDVA